MIYKIVVEIFLHIEFCKCPSVPVSQSLCEMGQK